MRGTGDGCIEIILGCTELIGQAEAGWMAASHTSAGDRLLCPLSGISSLLSSAGAVYPVVASSVIYHPCHWGSLSVLLPLK